MSLDQVFVSHKKSILYSLLVVLFSCCGVYLFKLNSVLSLPERTNLNNPMTDHVSHIYSSILFWDEGFTVYKKSPQDHLPYMHLSDRILLAKKYHWTPAHIFLREGSSSQALLINWPELTRGYPPGCFLLHAPAAFLVLNTDMDPNQIANWLILLYSLFAFLTCAEIARVLLKIALSSGYKKSAVPGAIVMIFGLTMTMTYWAGRGFYDPVALFFLVKALQFKFERKWDLSLLFYAIAFFLHFRAAWFFPLPLICLWELVRQVRAEDFSFRRSKWMISRVVVAALLGLLTCYTLILLKMHSQEWPVTNFMYRQADENAAAVTNSIYIYAIILGAMIYCYMNKIFSGAFFILSMFLLWVGTPQFAQWHSLFMAPFLLVFSEKKRMSDLFLGALFFYLLSLLVYDNNLFDSVPIKKFIGILLS